mgnify:CR=1 FL=1
MALHVEPSRSDRPSELRDFGAGQTIEQTGLYGRHPRWSVEVPVPEAGVEALAVSFLWSNVNPAHETAALAAIRADWPDMPPAGGDLLLRAAQCLGRFPCVQMAWKADPDAFMMRPFCGH